MCNDVYRIKRTEMKKVIAIIVILLPFAAFAQYAPYHPPGEDLEYMTDYQWNNWTRGFTVDGVFVKNLIGLPLNIVRKKEINYPFTITKIGPEKDTMVVSVDPRKTELGYINIRGFRCTQFTDYDSNNTSLCFMTLDEVRETYCPEVKGKVLYMINKFFVMKNAELYRIERLKVEKVEKVKSTDIDVLADLPEFTVVRIFTRTPHNIFPKYWGY